MNMGLTEVPYELFRMKLKKLDLSGNKLLLAAERNCAPGDARSARCAIDEAIGS
jgi:hypothetical protein